MRLGVRGEGRVRGKVMVLIVYNIGVRFRRELRVGFRLRVRFRRGLRLGFRLRVRLRVRVRAGSRLGTTFSTIGNEQN